MFPLSYHGLVLVL